MILDHIADGARLFIEAAPALNTGVIRQRDLRAPGHAPKVGEHAADAYRAADGALEFLVIRASGEPGFRLGLLEIEDGRYQAQVREGLRVVAEKRAGPRVDLLGV